METEEQLRNYLKRTVPSAAEESRYGLELLLPASGDGAAEVLASASDEEIFALIDEIRSCAYGRKA